MDAIVVDAIGQVIVANLNSFILRGSLTIKTTFFDESFLKHHFYVMVSGNKDYQFATWIQFAKEVHSL